MSKRNRIPAPPIYFNYHDLTEPFASDTGYLLTYVSQMAYLQFDQALDPLNIDARQYGVMTLIYSGTHRSQIAISEKLGFDRTHVVRLVDDLEEIGYVQREKDPNDRRYYRLVLTAKGETVLKEAQERAAAAQADTYSCLDAEERTTLNRLLRKLGDQRFAKRNSN
ncbi:MAG: MarR family winged helix-turn-helix transcriptional regulator [Chloroflexota bacterium]